MSSTLKTILIVLAVLVVGGALFLAGYLVRGPQLLVGRVGPSVIAPYPDSFAGPGMMQGWRGAGPGMMQQWNYRGRPGATERWSGGYGPGMMNRWSGGYGAGPGMMGGPAWGVPGTAPSTPLSVDEARAAAQEYIDDLEIAGLETGEVMIFDNHAYVVIEETATGLGAFELLVDPVANIAYPEHGPNMMWNLKYGGVNHAGMMGRRGMMGGMMGAWQYEDGTPAEVTSEMPIAVAEAREAAQKYLDQFVSGAEASSTPVQFYGYYTFDFEQDGSEAGMLSVNGFNGQVFLHTWHGTFIEEAE